MGMEVLTLRLPPFVISALEELVRKGIYPNRSEAIRKAVLELLLRHEHFLKPQTAAILRRYVSFSR